MPESVLYLIRHAESAPDFALAEADWPLSARGQEQAERLADALGQLGLTRLASSPYRRAIATIEPFALRERWSIQIETDLRERKLTQGRSPDWQALLARSWRDLDHAESGAESGRDCQRRVGNCLARLVAAHGGETIAAASHGNAIALLLTTLDPSFGYEGWRTMRNPDGFRLIHSDAGWHWDRSYRLELT